MALDDWLGFKGARAIHSSLDSLAATIKFTPYHDGLSHIYGFLSIFTHSLRLLNNVLHIVANVLKAVSYLLFPPYIIFIPPVLIEIATHALAACICLLNIAVKPFIFTIRTFASLAFKYQENSDYDYPTAEDEEEDAQLEFSCLIP